MKKNVFYLYIYCTCFFLSLNCFAQQESSTKPITNLIQPPFLKQGDTVAIVAPAGILKHREGEINKSKTLLKSWGLHVVVGKHVFNQGKHFAGTDDERCEDFQRAMDDPSISAIWCARGGYGSVRIIDKLNWNKFKVNPKWVIGYSDITAIHSELHNKGFASIHAMMCTSMQDDAASISETIATFKKALFGETLSYTLKGSSYNQPGTATGPIVGGNLTILQTMLGSKTSINTAGKILFIEEIGEYKYHIDRMLRSLKRAGYFDKCKGIIIGDMTKIKRNTTVWGTTIEQLILDVLSDYNMPIAFHMKAGHDKDNRALLLGQNATLKVTKAQSSLIFVN